eukprot:6923458-Prymnesium_polylepis.2
MVRQDFSNLHRGSTSILGRGGMPAVKWEGHVFVNEIRGGWRDPSRARCGGVMCVMRACRLCPAGRRERVIAAAGWVALGPYGDVEHD